MTVSKGAHCIGPSLWCILKRCPVIRWLTDIYTWAVIRWWLDNYTWWDKEPFAMHHLRSIEGSSFYEHFVVNADCFMTEKIRSMQLHNGNGGRRCREARKGVRCCMLQKSIFGHGLYASGVTEDHKRGTLHWHCNIAAGLSACILQRCVHLGNIHCIASEVLGHMCRRKKTLLRRANGSCKLLQSSGFPEHPVIPIDEVSTLVPWHARKLNELLQQVNGNTKGFGRCSVLLVGDFEQLE